MWFLIYGYNKMLNKKGKTEFDFLFKLLLWLAVFAILGTGLYFLLKSLTG